MCHKSLSIVAITSINSINVKFRDIQKWNFLVSPKIEFKAELNLKSSEILHEYMRLYIHLGFWTGGLLKPRN